MPGISISVPVDSADDILREFGMQFGAGSQPAGAPPPIKAATLPGGAPAAAQGAPAIKQAATQASAPKPPPTAMPADAPKMTPQAAAQVAGNPSPAPGGGAPAAKPIIVPATMPQGTSAGAAPAFAAPGWNPAPGPKQSTPARVLGDIGEALGTAFVPSVMAAIPGTIQNRNMRQAQAGNQAIQQATLAHTGAETGLEQAQADALRNGKDPQQAAWEALVQKGVDPVAALQQITAATSKVQQTPEESLWGVLNNPASTPAERNAAIGSYKQMKTAGQPPRAMEHVELAGGAGGAPIEANYDPAAGVYTDASGNAIQNPTAYVAPKAEEPRAGTANGKPATGILTPGGWVDAQTRQPIPNFTMGEPQQPNYASMMMPMQGAARLTTENDNWGKNAGDIESAVASLGNAKNGSELAASLGPLQTALTVVGAGGVHRINTAELARSGDSAMGSIGRRIDAALQKAGNGALPASTITEMQQLLGMYKGVLYGQYVARSQAVAKNYKLDSGQQFITAPDGQTIIPLSLGIGVARAQKAGKFNMGVDDKGNPVMSLDGGKTIIEAETGQPYKAGQ